VNTVLDRADLRRLHVMAGAIAMIMLIGVIDYVTGAEASIAPLYLLPIALATWFVGLRAGLPLAGLSAVIRLQDLWLTTYDSSSGLSRRFPRRFARQRPLSIAVACWQFQVGLSPSYWERLLNGVVIEVNLVGVHCIAWPLNL
jgi:hypothetical protein